MSKAKELVKKYKETKKIMMEELRQAFTEESKALFDEIPQMGSFSFTAYTPYFNDGDECTYSVNTDYPDLYDLEGNHMSYELREKLGTTEKVSDFLNAFPEEFYKDVFGDHIQVTVSKNKIEVSEYDHE